MDSLPGAIERADRTLGQFFRGQSDGRLRLVPRMSSGWGVARVTAQEIREPSLQGRGSGVGGGLRDQGGKNKPLPKISPVHQENPRVPHRSPYSGKKDQVQESGPSRRCPVLQGGSSGRQRNVTERPSGA